MLETKQVNMIVSFWRLVYIFAGLEICRVYGKISFNWIFIM